MKNRAHIKEAMELLNSTHRVASMFVALAKKGKILTKAEYKYIKQTLIRQKRWNVVGNSYGYCLYCVNYKLVL